MTGFVQYLMQRLFCGLRVAVITVDILLSTSSHCLFLLMLKPILFLGLGDLYWRLEGFLFERIFEHVATWIHTAGYRVCVHGDAIPKAVYTGRTLVISNHISTGDVPSLFYMWVASSPCPVQRLWWVMDILFKWSPFGWVSQVHRDHFIRQGKETRGGAIEQFSRAVGQDYARLPRSWCVVFPEGGFHRKRIEASNRFAEKNGLPQLEHVTYPRAGAIYAFTEALASASAGNDGGLEYIIDLTIGYADNKPFGLGDVILGLRQPSTVHVNQRVYSVAKDAVPLQSSDALLAWLYQRWQEKNSQLDEFYRTGQFGNTRHCQVTFKWPSVCASYVIYSAIVYFLYRLACLPFALLL